MEFKHPATFSLVPYERCGEILELDNGSHVHCMLRGFHLEHEWWSSDKSIIRKWWSAEDSEKFRKMLTNAG
jgi:hypothetical protein